MLRWYVVHTQVNGEPKANWHLSKQGFAVYLPRYLKRRRHARRVEIVAAPLFPRYLFVSFDLAVTRWRAIHSTIGVTDLVCNGENPAPVPIGIVEEIMARADENGMLSQPSAQRLVKGDKIEILDGPLEGLTGLFECTTDHERVVLLLDLLGRQTRVTVPRTTVRAA
jgi:transcriptional antiterminator RfaH